MNEEITPPSPELEPAPPVDPPPPPASVDEVVQQAQDRAEAAETRRRWITLAELVGVAGLVIAALSLWLGWSDRRADDQAKRTEQASEAKVRTLVILKGSRSGDNLVLSDAAHDIQSITVRFPTALGVAARIDANPQIDTGWFSAPLLTLTDGGPDNQAGRLPLLVTASYWDGDIERHDSAIYDVLWKTEGRMFRGRALRLESLRLRERTGSAARLDAIWAREKPRPTN